MLLQRQDIRPAFAEEKGRQAALVPGPALVRAFANPVVAGDNNPITLAAKSADPVNVLCLGGEFLLQIGVLSSGAGKGLRQLEISTSD